MSVRIDARTIIDAALAFTQPGEAVRRALKTARFADGRIVMIAVGKAAWQMAAAAADELPLNGGVIITKYGHSKGRIAGIEIWEAGHPVPDQNTFAATERALAAVSGLTERDNVLFLISGGGSALFEKPLIDPQEMAAVTHDLLTCGADITEINTIRKRLSAVKGGRFAQYCAPARVVSVILSDIIGDPLDMIASGPACPDSSTARDALDIVRRRHFTWPRHIIDMLGKETPKAIDNADAYIAGSVRQLCVSAKSTCIGLGYHPVVLTSSLNCAAREAGSFLAAIAREHQDSDRSLAFIAGGETVVHVTGNGKGGRNQELALAAAPGIDGLPDTAVFSVGSDGTDGPTDAAGGYVDGNSAAFLQSRGIDIFDVLRRNDAYHALECCDGLIMTGPTGTNVNDLAVALIRR